MPDTMIERVAQAIAADLLRQEPAHGGTYWVNTDNPAETVIDGTFDVLALARAAITAIREPNDAMVLAGAEIVSDLVNWGDCDGPAPVSEAAPSTIETFQAMIGAALKEAPNA